MTINLSGRVLPKFPTRVNEGVGIDISKSGGVWSFALDYTNIPLSGAASTGYIAVQLPDGTFGKVPASSALGLFSGAEQVKTSSYGVLPTDAGSPLIGNAAGPITFNLPTLGESTAGYLIRNIGTGTLTLDPNGAELIEGAATMALVRGQGALIWPGFDGWRAFEPAQNLLTKNNTFVRQQTIDISGTGIGNALRLVADVATPVIFQSEQVENGAGATTWWNTRTSTSPAASDGLLQITSRGYDSGGNVASYVSLSTTIVDPTDGAESSLFTVVNLVAGVTRGVFAVGAGAYYPTVTGGDPGLGKLNFAGYSINGTDLFARVNTWTANQTISTAALGNLLLLTTSEPSASTGPRLRMERLTASPAAADTYASIDWGGNNTTPSNLTLANQYMVVDDPTAGSEDVRFSWNTTIAGGLAQRWNMGGGIFYQGGTDPGGGKINVQELQIAGVSIFDRANTWTAAQAIIAASANPILTLTNGDPGSTGARILFNHDSASPAAADDPAILTFQGNSSTGAARTYARMRASVLDPTNTSEDAFFLFETIIAGTTAGRFRIGDGFYYNAGADPGSGNINVASDLQIAGVSLFNRQNNFTVVQTLSTTGAGASLLLMTSTDPGANSAARLTFNRNSASPAAADAMTAIEFKGNDSGLNTTDYFTMASIIDDPTDGSEDGHLTFFSTIAGGNGSRWHLGAGFYYNGGTDSGSGNMNALAYFRAGVQVVSARVTGYVAMTGTGNRNTVYDTATVTLAQLAGRVMSMQADLTAHGLIGP